MKVITVQFNNGIVETYRTTNSGSNLTLGQINSDFFRRNMIKECCNLNNWTDGTLNKTNAFSYFGAKVLKEKKVDGRFKSVKKLQWFKIQMLVLNK